MAESDGKIDLEYLANEATSLARPDLSEAENVDWLETEFLSTYNSMKSALEKAVDDKEKLQYFYSNILECKNLTEADLEYCKSNVRIALDLDEISDKKFEMREQMHSRLTKLYCNILDALTEIEDYATENGIELMANTLKEAGEEDSYIF